MDEYVKLDVVLGLAGEYVQDLDDLCAFRDAIESLEPETVKAAVFGRWILHKGGSATCDQCRRTQKDIWDYDSYQRF